MAPTMEAPTVTNPYEWGKVDPTVRDAEMKETRSGDLSQAVWGLYVDAQDFLYNLTGMNSVKRYEANSFKGMRENARAGLMTDAKAAGTLIGKILPYLPKKPQPFTGGGGGW